MSAILPYLTIHMQTIGISIKEIAVIYACLPFTSFLGPPLLGILADKLGEHKTVLIISTFASGLFHTLLLAVPVYREVPILAVSTFHWNTLNDQMELRPPFLEQCDEFRKIIDNQSPRMDILLTNCLSHSQYHLIPEDLKTLDDNIMIPSEETSECLFFMTENNGQKVVDLRCTAPKDKDPTGMDEFIITSDFVRPDFNPTANCSLTPMKNSLGLEWGSSQDSYISCSTNVSFATGEIERKGNNATTFWMYFILRILASVFMISCFSLLDATTLAVVNRNGKSEYGKERILCIIGLAVTSPVAGILVDRVSYAKGYKDYSPAFYVSNFLLAINIGAYCLLDLKVEKPEKGVWQ